MAQSITNTIQSTNPFAGLLGLTPKPKATSSLFGGNQTSTPPTMAAPTSAFNFGNTPAPSQFNVATGKSTSPLSVGALSLSGQQQQQAPAPVQRAPISAPTPQYNAAVSAPVAPAAPQAPAAPAAPFSNVKGLFPEVVTSLAGYSTRNNALSDKAQQIGDTYGREYADIGKKGAAAGLGYLTTGTNPVAEGNAANVARTTAAQQSAVAAGETAALQGVNTGITANNAGASALSSAGNLAQPQVTSYGQTSFNPATGEFAGGGSLPAEVMQQYAQMAASGQYAGIPSFITSNPVLNAQLNVAAKSLNPSYTPVGAAAASGVLSGIPAMQSASTAAEGIKNTINTYLQANPNLNPSDLAAGNKLQQWIQGQQLTDPKYQTLFDYLNEYTNTIAPILGVGGNPTDLKTRIASGFINAAASGQSISQVLDAMSMLATHKIQDLQSGAVGGGTSVPNTATSGTGGFAEAW